MRYVVQTADNRLLADGGDFGKTQFLPPLWGLYQGKHSPGERTTMTFRSVEGAISQVYVGDIVVLMHYNPSEESLVEGAMRIWTIV